jgi:hypothetical protein
LGRDPDDARRISSSDFQHRLDVEDAREVLGPVVVAAPDAERCGDESFLDVVADRTSRDPGQPRQIADRIAH